MPHFAYVASVTLMDGTKRQITGDAYDRRDERAAQAAMVVESICERSWVIRSVDAFSALENDWPEPQP